MLHFLETSFLSKARCPLRIHEGVCEQVGTKEEDELRGTDVLKVTSRFLVIRQLSILIPTCSDFSPSIPG